VLTLDLEPMFPAEMLKRLLQQNRHDSDLCGCPLWRRFRRRSGHQTRLIRTARFMRTPTKTRYVGDGLIIAPWSGWIRPRMSQTRLGKKSGLCRVFPAPAA